MPKARKKNAPSSTDDTAIYSLNSDLLAKETDKPTISKEEAIEYLKKKIQGLSH